MCGAPDQATLDRSGIADGATVIQGLVRDGDAPLAGGYVRLLDAGGDFTAEVLTSATGQFRFFARSGQWTVRVVPSARHAGTEASLELADGDIGELHLSV